MRSLIILPSSTPVPHRHWNWSTFVVFLPFLVLGVALKLCQLPSFDSCVTGNGVGSVLHKAGLPYSANCCDCSVIHVFCLVSITWQMLLSFPPLPSNFECCSQTLPAAVSPSFLPLLCSWLESLARCCFAWGLFCTVPSIPSGLRFIYCRCVHFCYCANNIVCVPIGLRISPFKAWTVSNLNSIIVRIILIIRGIISVLEKATRMSVFTIFTSYVSIVMVLMELVKCRNWYEEQKLLWAPIHLLGCDPATFQPNIEPQTNNSQQSKHGEVQLLYIFGN